MLLQNTMIIGADVSHPGGGTPGTGSIAALVGTIDPRCLLYRSVARPNLPRTEVGAIQRFNNLVSANPTFR